MGKVELIEKIRADARARVAAILKEKEAEISEIKKRTEATCVRLKMENAKKIEERIKLILDNARSQAGVEKRKILLLARWRVIDMVTERAKQTILANPDYSALIQHLIEKYATDDATVHLSKEDTSRFIHLLNKKGIKIGAPLPISGGVVIQKEKEKLDLSLDAILSEVRDELLPELARILFPEN